MDIINTNFRKGIVKLRVSDLDDLWYLSHIIEPGDFVRGKTTRKIKIGDGENAKVTKKTLTLKVEAETVEFSVSRNSLRINGKIKEGPEDIPKDSYHTVSLKEGSEFIIEKVKWMEYQKQKLAEASEQKFDYLLCLFDREEALFALTKKNGYEILLKFKGDVPKKSKDTQVKKDFKQELIKILETYAARHSPENIILASPAFYKEDLFKKINDPDLKKKIVLAVCSSVDESSLDEVMKRPELGNILKSSRARQEKLLVDELLSEINKNNLATYGWDDVKKAIDSGAVSKLLLTDEFIQKRKSSNKYSELDEAMKNIDHLKGEIHIISSDQESGKKLDGLGGVAAILRFKLEW